MNYARTLLATLAALALPSVANATVINFDDLGNSVEVTNQYAGVVFSSSAGSRILTTAQNLGSSLPNFICSATGSINCTDPVFVDFATGVSGLSFLAIGDDDVGDVGDVRVFAGATLLGTVDVITDGNSGVPNLVDVSAFSGITRIEIVNISDAAGLGFDDFTFTVGVRGVPEPASWAMMIAGFGLVGAAVRGRRQVRAIA